MNTNNKSRFMKITMILLIFCILAGNNIAEADINNGRTVQENSSVTGSSISIPLTPVTGSAISGSAISGSAISGSAISGSAVSGSPVPSAAPSVIPSASAVPEKDNTEQSGLSDVLIKAEISSKYIATGKSAELTAVLYYKNTGTEKEVSKEEYDNYSFSWYKKQGKKDKLLKQKNSKCNIKIENKGISSYYCIAENKENGNAEIKSSPVKVTGYKSSMDVIYKKRVTIEQIFGLPKKKTANAILKTKNKNAKKNVEAGKGVIKSTGYCQEAKVSVKLNDMEKPVIITVNTKLPEPKLVLKLLKDKKTLVGYCRNASDASYIELRFRRPYESKYIYMSVIGDKFKHATSKKKKGRYVNMTKLEVKEYKARAVYKIGGKTIKTGWSKASV